MVGEKPRRKDFCLRFQMSYAPRRKMVRKYGNLPRWQDRSCQKVRAKAASQGERREEQDKAKGKAVMQGLREALSQTGKVKGKGK